MYTVILGDMVQSREIPERELFATRVSEVLTRVAERFAAALKAGPRLTKGLDELSAVMRSPVRSYDLCSEINRLVWPQSFRFAIVRGEIDVLAESSDASLMDGPAFHRAAELISRAKRNNRQVSCWLTGGAGDSVCSDLASFCFMLKAEQSDRQREVAELYLELKTQREVAQRLGVSQQSVSDALRAGRYAELQRAERSINEYLQAISDAQQR